MGKTNSTVKDMLDRAVSDAQKQIPSEEITYIEMMENLAHARREEEKKNASKR